MRFKLMPLTPKRKVVENNRRIIPNRAQIGTVDAMKSHIGTHFIYEGLFGRI